MEETHNIRLTVHRELMVYRVAAVDGSCPDAEAAWFAREEIAEGIVVTVPNLKYWNILKASLAR